MEWVGVSIDLPWFASLKERFKRERERVEKEIYAEAGGEFNINSNNQLRTILFDKLQLPVRKRTATGPSTDASVLQELADAGHNLPAITHGISGTIEAGEYVSRYAALLDPSWYQRLHTSFNQTVAFDWTIVLERPESAEHSNSSRVGTGHPARLLPRKGWLFLAADYSQIELRLLAHLVR